MRQKCLLAIVPLLAPSCVTASVWGGGVEDGRNGKGKIVWSGDTPLSSSPWINALATPFSLVADLCLLPVQACLYGWNDDDDC